MFAAAIRTSACYIREETEVVWYHMTSLTTNNSFSFCPSLRSEGVNAWVDTFTGCQSHADVKWRWWVETGWLQQGWCEGGREDEAGAQSPSRTQRKMSGRILDGKNTEIFSWIFLNKTFLQLSWSWKCFSHSRAVCTPGVNFSLGRSNVVVAWGHHYGPN